MKQAVKECFVEDYLPWIKGLNPLEASRVDYLKSLIMKLQHEGFIPELKEPALDIGTGIGTGAAVLRNLGMNDIYGIDTNQVKLERSVNEERLERSKAIKGSATDLIDYFGRERFGTVTAFHAPICGEAEGIHGFFENNIRRNERYYFECPEAFKPVSMRNNSSVWSIAIPFQAAQVLRSDGVALFTMMTKYEADILKNKFYYHGVIGEYRQIKEESGIELDAFLYVGRKQI